MGIVLQFRRPAVSAEVVAKLIKLGYLQPTKRYRAGVVENAVERLRRDLHRDGVISAGDISPTAKDEQRDIEQPGIDQALQVLSAPDAS
jgi:hypothetical protein